MFCNLEEEDVAWWLTAVTVVMESDGHVDGTVPCEGAQAQVQARAL